MARNVMKLLKPSPHRARHDFDLSHRHLFDANFGELLPATCIETVPGDNIELRAADLLRTIPSVRSPYLRAKQHLDVWFVPYRDLWHNFGNFITSKREPVSSALHSDNYLPWCTTRQLWEAIDSHVSTKDVVGRDLTDRAYYLLQLLGYGDLSSVDSASPYKVNMFRLAAYNYIWYYEYRQQYYDDGTRLLSNGVLASKLFNFDDLICDTVANAGINTDGQYLSRLSAMCQMRYRCWKKDLFTGLLPSTQFGNISTVTSRGFLYPSTPNNFSTTSGQVTGVKNSDDTLSMTNINGGVATQVYVNSDFNVLALRKSEAIQIWRENALRAGNHVKDNMMAHYGVASDFDDHRPTYLGSVDSPLNISDVLSTATTNAGSGMNDVLGDIAGKGTSSLNDKVFKFHSKDFGVIMVMFSLLPEAEYEATGIERTNQLLEMEDFFIPEYENLGLEPVGLVNFARANESSVHNIVMGYAPRYYGYKTKLDKVFGEFCGLGIFRQWSAQRNDLQAYLVATPTTIPLSCLYVSPLVFNSLFILTTDNSPQFLCDIYFDVDAVRPMSVVGTPFS